MAVPGLDPGISPGHPDPVKLSASINRDRRQKAGDDEKVRGDTEDQGKRVPRFGSS
jgi:hypothetical protein